MKKVLIVFTDVHLAYSPSTLNLYDSLANDFDVTILSFEPGSDYSVQRTENRKVKYIIWHDENNKQPQSLFKRIKDEIIITIDHKLKRLSNPSLSVNANSLITEIKKFNGEMIAVDFFALWCIQQAGKSAHLLSLEIHDQDIYRQNCEISNIKSVIIQSKARYEYLFKGKDLNYFIVQNAPKYIDTKINIEMRSPFKLVVCGSAMPWFGIYSCIDFLCDYPQYSLTIKGAIPSFVKSVIKEKFTDLLDSKRLILDEVYLNETELNEYLKSFYIGFVFYDHFRFDFINTFNYRTAPSGKLFQYYNAGVPVICNKIEGLDSVDSLSTGISIDTMSSLQIKNAIESISFTYQAMSLNAKQASKHFDFSANVKPFIEFLQQCNN
jgi:hypothetical protein